MALFSIILLTFLAGFGAGYLFRDTVGHAPAENFRRMSRIRRRAF